MQLKVRIAGVQSLRHRQQGRDANAAGNQQSLLIGNFVHLQAKQIAGLANAHAAAPGNFLVQTQRTALAMHFAFYRNAVAAAVPRLTTQRILAHHPGIHLHVNMGAGRPCRQRGAMQAHQLVGAHVGRYFRHTGHFHLDPAPGVLPLGHHLLAQRRQQLGHGRTAPGREAWGQVAQKVQQVLAAFIDQ